ncbi:pimeloyl-ACP methyl ester carboxylesterase [Kribbella sp. VKM Ac-2569]|uniref:alpha/beta fold hydrolase n=1 Tax=Kribbella sp. VKM Ac-2569 TaxID=2512220 RepID=UPI00102B8947|nr:alpha/beta hydrolase [Kribbella sp. VKM Ac-2569]RZT17026.1 pimeloyl-ACP methyl ester carboxylesterase [Kribbella sp. VKM Ac-2569]
MTLHHVSFGDGVPVLALHGWTPDHRLMTGCLEPIFTELPGYRRLYPDLPGMGESPAGDIDSSDGILAAVRAFIDEQIGDEPFVLIGESYGGYLARGLVAERPEQILGIGLICSVGTLWHKDRKLPEHAVLRSEPGVLESLTEGEDFTELAVVQTAEALAAYRSDVAPGLAVADTAALERIQKNWALSTAPESGPPYDGPSLIVCGRQDAVTGYEDQYGLLPHYPRATYAVLDVAGHNLQLEQPALFGALIREWLQRLPQIATSG